MKGTNRQQSACSPYPAACSGASSLSISPVCTLPPQMAAAAAASSPLTLETLHQRSQCVCSKCLGLSRSCGHTGHIGRVRPGHPELTDKPRCRGRSRDAMLRPSQDVLLTRIAVMTGRRPSTHQRTLVSSLLPSLPVTVQRQDREGVLALNLDVPLFITWAS